MNLTIVPKKLRGTVTPPPSKSQAHRLIIAAALADGTSTIENVAFSQDVAATLRCMEALGASWQETGPGVIQVQGMGGRRTRGGELPHLDCGESGSTLRFLIPIALALRGGGVFTGRGRLMERPQGPYLTLFREKGVSWEQEGDVLTVAGDPQPGRYALPGNVSSQFFTGLFFALPLLDGESAVVPTTDLESAGYLAITREAQERFGVRVGGVRPEGFRIAGNQAYRPCTAQVEADWSQAAFWYAAANLGSDVAVTGMNPRSPQGDRSIVDLLDFFDGVPADRGLDVRHIPDLVPPLAALAAGNEGCTRLKNAGRLRLKESDRLTTVRETLETFGVRVEERPDSLSICGRQQLRGNVAVDCCNDHRIAMMAAVLATRADGPVTLTGAECVKKSYPDFWEEYHRVGGEVHVL